MAKPQHSSAQFEYSLYSINNSTNEQIPLDSLVNKETGNTIYYVDSFPECYSIKLTNKKQTNDKLLINFKLSFGAEKYGQRELATINQWKLWHDPIGNTASSNKELEFITINPKNDSTDKSIQDLSDKDLLNLKTFLWNATAASATPTDCEFILNFGCHSNQFPIKLNSAGYTGSVFVLSIDIYSVASKQKLDSFELKLKISIANSSLFKEDCGIDLENVQKLDSMETNLHELLSNLRAQPIAKETGGGDARLPTYDQLKAVKLDYGLFAYRFPSLRSNLDYNSNPIAQVTGTNYNFEIENLHFAQFYGKNDLIKTVITLELENSVSGLENWKHLNPNKSFLKGTFKDDEFFDVYSAGVAELALIWNPTKKVHSISITFSDLQQLKGLTINTKVESFLVENGTKVDEAKCNIYFYDSRYTQTYSGIQYNSTTLINNQEFLIKKALFLAVDGNEYRPLVCKQPFCSNFKIDQFKADLSNFIRRVKNVDTNFIIREIKYFATESQHKNREQGTIFDAKIFNQLKVKAILKCILRKDELAKSELVQYDVDFINQDENYLNAYL